MLGTIDSIENHGAWKLSKAFKMHVRLDAAAELPYQYCVRHADDDPRRAVEVVARPILVNRMCTLHCERPLVFEGNQDSRLLTKQERNAIDTAVREG